MCCLFKWESPGAPALTWLTQSGKEGAALSYAQLNAAAAAAARGRALQILPVTAPSNASRPLQVIAGACI